MNNFTGSWQTSFGPMKLVQEGKRVQGAYHYMDVECPLEGRVVQGRLHFTYREATLNGEGWFELRRHGQVFSGLFRPLGVEQWSPWEGERIGFDGLWNTSFGLMRLIEEAGRIHGYYEGVGSAALLGRRAGNCLNFKYKEPTARGQGRFELAADGLSFQGEWRPLGQTNWKPWTGIRVRAQPNLAWLVVLEAPWQRLLSDREYSFGSMLREFFARVPEVQVRHRFFTNEAGLRKCCRDLLYIAEPVVLVLATHAQPNGITVDGQTIEIAPLLEDLRHVANLRLLHFSACLLLQGSESVRQLQAFANHSQLAVSGYRTSVDWAASAIIEFTYLDLILARGLAPTEAAEKLHTLLPFAGDDTVPEAPYPGAGFVSLAPEPTHRLNGAVRRRRKVV